MTPWPLSKRRLLTAEREQQLVKAIGDAELGNRGEVRVHIEKRCKAASAMRRAQQLYQQQGMGNTADDTGIMLYVATNDRQVAIHAGAGVHQSGDSAFWQTVVDEVSDGFRRDEPMAGLKTALHKLGELLRRAIPGDDSAGNELPDHVTTS